MPSDKSNPVLRYPVLLSDIKQRIRQAQTRAILAVNRELLALYWDIGCLIDGRQKQEGWGAAVIPRLAKDLRNELPEEKGFSERNIKLMVQFFHEYPMLFIPDVIGQPVVAQLTNGEPSTAKGQLVVAQIPWAHNVLLMQRVKDRATRIWYAEATFCNGWSRNVLLMQIESAAHTRQGKVTSNFSVRLPPEQSDLVQQALKDPYLFDFLTLTEPFHERELETGLIGHLEKFLLELGQGFAFVGRQYHLEVGDQDFYIDLLFYHLRLRCFVVIELKRGAFKPEYAGKMNFYCSVVDDVLKHTADAPTIGLILCQQQNEVIAEYALRGVDKPIGVSTFELTRALPAELKSSLPSIEQIEQELGNASTENG
jgi:predicted nuclease of restriction endonuclease-like (RecB) superfamily